MWFHTNNFFRTMLTIVAALFILTVFVLLGTCPEKVPIGPVLLLSSKKPTKRTYKEIPERAQDTRGIPW